MFMTKHKSAMDARSGSSPDDKASYHIITHHLQVRDADIIYFIDVGVPNHTNIGDVECPKVTLQ